MSLLGVALPTIVEADLQRLVANRVVETRELEYKRDAIGGKEAEKKEFLKDASAFANARGGDLIIGMGAQDGVPVEPIGGITVANIDDEVQRLESMIRDGIEPRLIGHQTRAIQLQNGNYVIVVRIPRSWNPPHRVSYQGWNKFFTRNSNGAHEVDVDELRAIFLGGAVLTERIEQFRAQRLDQIRRNEAPINVGSDGRLILHIAPLSTFGDKSAVNVSQAAGMRQSFHPISHRSGFQHRLNFDGLLTMSEFKAEGTWGSYLQLFRDGCIETAADGYVYQNPDNQKRMLKKKKIGPDLFGSIPVYLENLAEMGIDPPYLAMITITNIQASHIGYDYGQIFGPADRDSLATAPVLFNSPDLDDEWHKILKPVLDAIWNGFGKEQTDGFDQNENWRPT
jgi:hypothetical protein